MHILPAALAEQIEPYHCRYLTQSLTHLCPAGVPCAYQSSGAHPPA